MGHTKRRCFEPLSESATAEPEEHRARPLTTHQWFPPVLSFVSSGSTSNGVAPPDLPQAPEITSSYVEDNGNRRPCSIGADPVTPDNANVGKRQTAGAPPLGRPYATVARPSHSVRFTAVPRVHTFDPSYIGAVDRGPPTAPTYQAIPKPPGQVTRIKRGGYRLIEVLAWDEEYYKNVQKLVHELAKQHLDRRYCYSQQNPQQVDLVCDKARQQMRDRRVYEDDWHIKDFLRVYLHNSSREYRVSLKAGRV